MQPRKSRPEKISGILTQEDLHNARDLLLGDIPELEERIAKKKKVDDDHYQHEINQLYLRLREIGIRVIENISGYNSAGIERIYDNLQDEIDERIGCFIKNNPEKVQQIISDYLQLKYKTAPVDNEILPNQLYLYCLSNGTIEFTFLNNFRKIQKIRIDKKDQDKDFQRIRRILKNESEEKKLNAKEISVIYEFLASSMVSNRILVIMARNAFGKEIKSSVVSAVGYSIEFIHDEIPDDFAIKPNKLYIYFSSSADQIICVARKEGENIVRIPIGEDELGNEFSAIVAALKQGEQKLELINEYSKTIYRSLLKHELYAPGFFYRYPLIQATVDYERYFHNALHVIIEDIMSRKNDDEKNIALERWIKLIGNCLQKNDFLNYFLIKGILSNNSISCLIEKEKLSAETLALINKLRRNNISEFAKNQLKAVREGLDVLPEFGLAKQSVTFFSEMGDVEKVNSTISVYKKHIEELKASRAMLMLSTVQGGKIFRLLTKDYRMLEWCHKLEAFSLNSLQNKFAQYSQKSPRNKSVDKQKRYVFSISINFDLTVMQTLLIKFTNKFPTFEERKELELFLENLIKSIKNKLDDAVFSNLSGSKLKTMHAEFSNLLDVLEKMHEFVIDIDMSAYSKEQSLREAYGEVAARQQKHRHNISDEESEHDLTEASAHIPTRATSLGPSSTIAVRRTTNKLFSSPQHRRRSATFSTSRNLISPKDLAEASMGIPTRRQSHHPTLFSATKQDRKDTISPRKTNKGKSPRIDGYNSDGD